jgi:hypothetical protein
MKMKPYTYEDAYHRVLMNILHYLECFEENTEQYKQNLILLKQIEALNPLETKIK